MTTIADYAERELLLRRLATGDVDEELQRLLERMRRFFFRPWAALDTLLFWARVRRSM